MYGLQQQRLKGTFRGKAVAMAASPSYLGRDGLMSYITYMVYGIHITCLLITDYLPTYYVVLLLPEVARST